MIFSDGNKNFYGIIADVMEEKGQLLYKVLVPGLHGPEVKAEHLPFVQALSPPTAGGDATTAGALAIGSAVNFFKAMGDEATGFGVITGLFQPVNSTDKVLPGQNQSWSAVFSAPLEALTSNIRLPPDLEKIINDKGVEITKMVEKGMFSLSAIYELATHGATTPLNGVMIPQIKSIPTALQSAGQLLPGNIMSMLPGTNFSIGNLLDMIPTKFQEDLFSRMPNDVGNALKTIMKMAPKFTPSPNGGMGISGNRVDPTSLIEGAMKLLGDVKTVDGLIPVLQSLMADPALTGKDKLAHFATTFNGFGKTALKILGDGTIEATADAETTKALAIFSSLMGQFEASEGKLFDVVKQLPEMLDRLKPEVSSKISTVLGLIQSVSPAIAAANFVKGG